MGLKIPPVPDDYGIGNDCLACHAAGETPNYVFVRFWDVEPCGTNPPAPNGHTFICAQVPGSNCHFRGELWINSVHWKAWYHYRVRIGNWWYSEIGLTIHNPIVGSYYYEHSDICKVSFNANENFCPDYKGHLGHAHVQVFVPPIIILLSSGYHFVTQPGLLYETQDVGMDHQLVHLASRYDKTNVLIYLDEEELVFD